MKDFEAVMLVEGVDEAESEEQLLEAWQQLINSGMAWKLQGWFGRQADALIRAGVCEPGVAA